MLKTCTKVVFLFSQWSFSLLELLKTRKRARETGGNGPSCRDLRDAQAARPVALARLSATAAEVRVSCNLR